jgi:hypothetical protein
MPVDAARDERRARNEVLYREVNERIEDLSSDLSDYSVQEGSIDVVCECSRDRCTELLEVTRRQYEAVRSDLRRFIIVPGHEHTDTERVVERNSAFFVVEKLEDAAEIANRARSPLVARSSRLPRQDLHHVSPAPDGYFDRRDAVIPQAVLERRDQRREFDIVLHDHAPSPAGVLQLTSKVL